MKMNLYALLAMLVALSLLITACGPTPAAVTPGAEAQAEPTRPKALPQATAEEASAEEAVTGTVALWHAWTGDQIPALTKVIAAFQEMHSDVQFDVQYVPFGDLRGQVETAAATGGGPGVLIGASDWGPALFDAKAVTDLSTLASEELLQTINPAALGAVKYRDALIGLPQTIRGVVMIRNRSIIADVPATFDELVAAAQTATAGDIVGASLEQGFFFSAGHLDGLGGLLMDEQGQPLFNDEKGVEWLNLLDLFEEAGPTEYYTDNDVDLFKAGKVGIIIDVTWNMSDLAKAIGAENLVIDPWPLPLSGYVQTENIYLGANVEGADQDASWKFVEFFLSPAAQALLAGAGHIPAVADVEVTDPLMSQAADALAGGAAFPVIPEMGAYWEPMDTALRSFSDEGAEPEAVLSQAYNSVTAAVAEIRGETLPNEKVEGTVSLWHAWKEDEIPGLTEVIAAFQEKHPDVDFDVLPVPVDDLRGKFETAAATGRGPSALIGPADWGPVLYDAELVADVTAYTTTPFLASINEAALGAVKYKGALVGLPQTINGVAMFRNSSIIPDAPATFDELVAAARAATAAEIVGADLEQGFLFSAAHLHGMGGMLMDRDGDPMFNDEKGIEWLNLLSSFEDAGPTEYYTDNDVNLFKSGKAGVIIDNTLNMSRLVEAVGAENLVIDPWPAAGKGGGHLSGYVQAENIYLGADVEGDDLMATWKFIEFFLSPEAQAILSGVGRIPAVTDVQVSDPLILQATDAFAGGTAFPVSPEMGAYWEPMDQALKSVFDEGADPAEVLQVAFDSITAAIAEIRDVQ
ncbi:extracellular solute-binding protein [Chloroflexota bacterium]